MIHTVATTAPQHRRYQLFDEGEWLRIAGLFEQGLGVAEVCDVLGIAPRTFRYRMKRAGKALAREFVGGRAARRLRLVDVTADGPDAPDETDEPTPSDAVSTSA